MKKLLRLIIIVIIPIVVGYALVKFAGSDHPKLLQAGDLLLHLIGPILITVAVCGVFMAIVVGKKNSGGLNDEKEDEIDLTNNKAEDAVDDFSYDDKDSLKELKSTAKLFTNNYKNLSPKQKVISCILISIIMTVIVLVEIFIYFKITVGIIACMAAIVLLVLIAFIYGKTSERRSMKVDFDWIRESEILTGRVKLSMISSARSVGEGRYGKYRTPAEMLDVVYKVIIEYEDKDYTAFSKDLYEDGESVQFVIIGKNKASIKPREKSDEGESVASDGDTF